MVWFVWSNEKMFSLLCLWPSENIFFWLVWSNEKMFGLVCVWPSENMFGLVCVWPSENIFGLACVLFNKKVFVVLSRLPTKSSSYKEAIGLSGVKQCFIYECSLSLSDICQFYFSKLFTPQSLDNCFHSFIILISNLQSYTTHTLFLLLKAASSNDSAHRESGSFMSRCVVCD